MKRIPACHPDRPYYALGLCVYCYGVKRRAENPEKLREEKHNYHATHREKARERNRRARALNPEKDCVASRKYRAANLEKERNRSRKFAKEKPLTRRANRIRRRARKRNAPGVPYAVAEFRALCDESSWQCAYCSTVLDIGTVQADHVIPLSRGGSNSIENIAVCCGPCNVSKGHKPLDVWLKRRKKVA